MTKQSDQWGNGDPYEFFMGRWSSLMAVEFLNWLNIDSSKMWLEIGCGTGALSESIIDKAKVQKLICIEPSMAFLNAAKNRVGQEVEFILGDASDLPVESNSMDVIVSGLALNFFSDLDKALDEMKRVAVNGATLAAYVWDYSGRMDFLRIFWDAAINIDPEAISFDEAIRFPICNEINLQALFNRNGYKDSEVVALDIKTVFKDFNDFWDPFLGRQGPAPGYYNSLEKEKQEALRCLIQKKIKYEKDGSINMIARSFAIRSIV